MNIGILGTGFGAYHASILKKFPEIGRVIVFGRNESKLHKLQQELGVEITTSLDEVICDPGLDIIDICLPSALHKQYTLDALQAGKHVFCETPVCLSAEDAAAMKHAEEQSGKSVLVNQFIKFDPAYQYLYESAVQKKYGRLLKVRLLRETAPLWGDLGLGTITTNLMIHDLDFVSWLLGGTAPSWVWGSQGGQEGQALVEAIFNNPNVSAEVIASSLMPAAYPFTVGYEAYFERAKLEFHEKDDMQGGVDIALYEYSETGSQEIVLDKVNPYEKSLQHALQCFQDGSESFLSLEQALISLHTALELKSRLAVPAS
ncbi:1,5-anhydro-D-fructose reductase [Paenibacillus auburnensis]|uniref:1,5-anhydro-D-fructose reductase n=1 Tax=Paenibacillus auburnensis TaxID=2905649 RepID=A0ABM9BS25_9BACL|nr:Gfo/Idh/MocA family oxidoreductase [Paenibacillus auburnensis]CAH1192464.1 1,5-anhydro-D-fructose reductase [Paenibacillus auburnensis]